MKLPFLKEKDDEDAILETMPLRRSSCTGLRRGSAITRAFLRARRVLSLVRDYLVAFRNKL